MKTFFLLIATILITSSTAYDESDCIFFRHIKPIESLNFLVCSIGIAIPPHIQTVQRYGNEPIKGLIIANSSNIAEDSIFGTFNAVTYYGLLYHNIQRITKESLDYLTFLEGLDVTNGNLMKIDYNSFQEFTSLRDIDLSRNKLDYIHPQLFTSLTNLEKVNLKGNQLVAVEPELFINNKKLSFVNLQDNKIVYIHQQAFDNNRDLRELYLLGNLCINVDYRQPRMTSLKFIFARQCSETVEIINKLSDQRNEAELINYEDEYEDEPEYQN